MLALTVLLELAVAMKPAFPVESILGFGAWFGFASCLVMVLVAKGLGLLLKRDERFYAEADERDD